jgi:hypothetical protein
VTGQRFEVDNDVREFRQDYRPRTNDQPCYCFSQSTICSRVQ